MHPHSLKQTSWTLSLEYSIPSNILLVAVWHFPPGDNNIGESTLYLKRSVCVTTVRWTLLGIELSR